MKKIYIIKDKTAGAIVNSFTDINLACAVRNLRANVTEMKLKANLVTLNIWDDSILIELTPNQDFTEWKVTETFKMSDITKLPKEEENGQKTNS